MGVLELVIPVATGPSNENPSIRVPVSMEMVSARDCEPPTPRGAPHSTVVSPTHSVLWQTVEPSRAVPDVATLAKL